MTFFEVIRERGSAYERISSFFGFLSKYNLPSSLPFKLISQYPARMPLPVPLAASLCMATVLLLQTFSYYNFVYFSKFDFLLPDREE